MNPYNLIESGGMRGKYSAPTSAYDLNEVGGFGKRKYFVRKNKLKKEVKNG